MNTQRSRWLLAGVALLSGIGLTAGNATAQDVYSTSSTDKIFQTAGFGLGGKLDFLAGGGACGDACCVDECGEACTDDGCGEGCGEGCGAGCGLLGDCCLGEPEQLIGCVGNGIQIGGWIQMGYHNNSTGAPMFNDHPGKARLHQLWLYAEKAAARGCDWDMGFRVDTVYGVDAQNTQAFGNQSARWDNSAGFDNGIYGWAMPQAYVEVARDDLSIIAGHFFTIVGYETVTAPDNFFYSHAMTMNMSEPFTHTGVLATYTVDCNTEVYGGWTLGWDTGFDQATDGSNFLGGISTALTDSATLTYVTTIGEMGRFNGGAGRGEGYSHSLVLDTQLTSNLNYVIQSDLVRFSLGGADIHNNEYGLNQYLFYSVNDCLAFGTRLEWWKSNAPSVTGFRGGAPGHSSNYSATFGVNYRPHANVVIRPELRHDWTPASGFQQDIAAIDAIVTF